MTVHTDTLTIPTETPEETTAPPEVDPPSSGDGHPRLDRRGPGRPRRRGLAFATFTGGGDSYSDIPAQGFYPEAEQIEREAHLEGQARTYLGTPSTRPPPTPGSCPIAGTCRRAELGGRGRGPVGVSAPAGAPHLIEA